MNRRLGLLFCGLVALTFAPRAGAGVLNVGEALELRFNTLNPSCPIGACDTLVFFPQEFGSFFATGVTAQLFDGPSLLGTYSNASCCLPTFRSSSSLFQVGSATVDFTAIDAGTIDGVLDMSIATGFLTWPDPPTAPYIPDLLIGHATNAGTVFGGTGLQVTSIRIVSAPEPSAVAALLGGLAVLGCRRRAGRSRTSA